MDILIAIIEKDGEDYIGRSPNLLGITITAKTRDEAESGILKAIEKRIDELNNRHGQRIKVSYKPIEESIPCVYKPTVGWNKGNRCLQSAQKDNLCWQHWRKVYGHPVGSKDNNESCPLCGEMNQDVLLRWESPCPFKAQNSNWEEVLWEIRKERPSTRTKAERESRIKSHLKNATRLSKRK
jgi:predicted RNase H-like HicB family nuclease